MDRKILICKQLVDWSCTVLGLVYVIEDAFHYKTREKYIWCKGFSTQKVRYKCSFNLLFGYESNLIASINTVEPLLSDLNCSYV